MNAVERVERTVSELVAAVDRAPSWKDWPFAELKVSKPGREDAALHDCCEELRRLDEVLTCNVCGAEFERAELG